MKTNRKQTELQFLEDYRLLFTNLEKVPEIAEQMAEYGYDEAKIAEGEALYQTAEEYHRQIHKERDEEKVSYKIFSKEFDNYWEQYRKHRRKLKVALIKHSKHWSSFKVDTTLPHSYLKRMEYMRIFYQELENPEPEIQELLTRFKLTPSIAQQGQATFEQIEQLRANYEKEKGESQQITQTKNQAFEQIADWIKDFHMVAQIALEEHPQLLESIGIFVRS